MVRIVAKGRTFQTHVERYFISSLVPETAQGFKPNVLDPLSIQQTTKRIPIEVGEFARTWESPDVGNDLDLEFLQKKPKSLKRLVRMSNSEKP
jgi:hypothetical protein